jgi:peptide/nickel transport system ATP-binding protein
VFKGIPGLAPSLLRLPSGCTFHPRCPHVMEHCKTVRPDLMTLEGGGQVACHLYTEKAVAHEEALA